MKHAYIYIFFVLLCLIGVLRISAENSIDNLITSIAPSVFELSSNIDDQNIDDEDMIDLDKDKFIALFSEEVRKNKAFYHGSLLLEFYFYNVNTLSICGDGLNCNGVQIKVTMKAFYMLNKVKEYRYQIKYNG